MAKATRSDKGRSRPRGRMAYGRALSAVEQVATRAYTEGRQSAVTQFETAILGGATPDELAAMLSAMRGADHAT